MIRVGICCLAGWLALAGLVVYGEGEAVPGAAAGYGRRLGVVLADNLNVRARPGLAFEVVAKLGRGDEVVVVDEQGEWLAIAPPPGTAAWCSTEFLDANGRVVGHNVRVRSGPGIVFSSYDVLPEQSQVRRIGRAVREWQQIEAPATSRVWINREYVQVEPPPVAPQDAPPATVADVAAPPQAAAPGGDQLSPTAVAGERVVPKLVVETVARIDSGELSVDQALRQAVAADDGLAVADQAAAGEGVGEAAAVGKPEAGSLVSLPALPLVGEASVPAVVMIDETFIRGAQDGSPVGLPKFRQGVLVSLQSKATAFASHVLVDRQGDQAHLVCYLVADLLELEEWANHSVKVYGQEISYPGWRVPVLRVTGIQLAPK